MNVSEYIIKYIEEKRINHIFAVVGGASLWLFKALNDSGEIKPIFTNHEQAAVMAADGWARVNCKPGIVFTINGPGMTNTVTGIAQAWVDSSPVILITGNSNSASVNYERQRNMRQYGTQDVRTDLIMHPITKKTFYLDRASDVKKCLDEAFYVAMEGRPGPICIEVPINIQSSQVPEGLEGWEPEKKIRQYGTEKVKMIISKINAAKRPLILAGQGVRLSGAVEQLNVLTRKMGIPVVTSRMGIDVISEDSEFYVGRPGNHGSRAAHFAIQTCDLLLILGSRMAPNTTGYHVEGFSNQSYKILVEIDESEMEKNLLKIDEVIPGDIKEFLEETLCLVDTMGKMEHHEVWQSCCQKWRETYPIIKPEYYQTKKLSTYAAVETVADLAEEGAYILSDTGSCCSIVAQVWKIKKQQRLFISGGLSAMGYWATSMGIALDKGLSNQVICFVGDGSLQMNIQELATLNQYQIPVKLFVISNNGYQFVRMSQESYGFNPTYGTSVAEGVPIPDIKRLVEAYGLNYGSCDSIESLEDIVKITINQNGPIVCEIFVDENQEVCPRLKSVALPDGTFRAPKYENLYPFLPENVLEKEKKMAMRKEDKK